MGPRILRGVYISWSNIFFISRPVQDTSYYRTKLMVLIQIIRFPLNMATFIGLLGYIFGCSPFSDSLKLKLGCGTAAFMVMGILNFTMLITNTYTRYSESGYYEVTKNEECVPLQILEEEKKNLNLKVKLSRLKLIITFCPSQVC